jgi:type IV pilus assembly protein PilA
MRGANRQPQRREIEMRKLLRRKLMNQAGFTLMELIVVVLIVGILAAVGVPLYLGYVRDSRLAEAKALAGAALTAAQACAQNDPTGATCTLGLLAQRIGVTNAGLTGDGKWTVGIAAGNEVTLNVTTNRFAGGPVTVAGTAAIVANMGAAVFIDGTTGVVTIHCNTTSSTVAATDPLCG